MTICILFDDNVGSVLVANLLHLWPKRAVDYAWTAHCARFVRGANGDISPSYLAGLAKEM